MAPVPTKFLLYFYASHYLVMYLVCIAFTAALYVIILSMFGILATVSDQTTPQFETHCCGRQPPLIPPAMNKTKTKFIKCSSSWVVYGCSVGQIPHLLWYLMNHDPVDYSPILYLILSQFTPFHIAHPVFKTLLVCACLCWEAYQVDTFRFSH
jgi:hypothetical protein